MGVKNNESILQVEKQVERRQVKGPEFHRWKVVEQDWNSDLSSRPSAPFGC